MKKNIFILALSIVLIACLAILIINRNQILFNSTTKLADVKQLLKDSLINAYKMNPAIFITTSYEAIYPSYDAGFDSIKIKVSNNMNYVAQQVLVDVYVWTNINHLVSLDHLNFKDIPPNEVKILTVPSKREGHTLLPVIVSTRVDSIQLLKVTPFTPPSY